MSTIELTHEALNVLYIPSAYISGIQSLVDNSKSLIMSDSELNKIKV